MANTITYTDPITGEQKTISAQEVAGQIMSGSTAWEDTLASAAGAAATTIIQIPILNTLIGQAVEIATKEFLSSLVSNYDGWYFSDPYGSAVILSSRFPAVQGVTPTGQRAITASARVQSPDKKNTANQAIIFVPFRQTVRVGWSLDAHALNFTGSIGANVALIGKQGPVDLSSGGVTGVEGERYTVVYPGDTTASGSAEVTLDPGYYILLAAAGYLSAASIQVQYAIPTGTAQGPVAQASRNNKGLVALGLVALYLASQSAKQGKRPLGG